MGVGLHVTTSEDQLHLLFAQLENLKLTQYTLQKQNKQLGKILQEQDY